MGYNVPGRALSERLSLGEGVPEKYRRMSRRDWSDLTTQIVAICLESDTASRMLYEDIDQPDAERTHGHAGLHGVQHEQVDRPMTRRTDAPHRKSRVGRNDPCPCGSGRKYKKCCGRLENEL